MHPKHIAARSWASGLSLAILLSACGGGGSGGGGPGPTAIPSGGGSTSVEGTAVPASELVAAQVSASPSLLQSIIGAFAFPLYPVANPSASNAAREQDAGGAVTISYQSSTGARALTFAAGDVTSSDSGGFVAQKGTNNIYSEFWADDDIGWSLEHSRLSIFFFADAGVPQVSLFYFGAETPAAQVPVSAVPGLGTAQYDGKTTGYIFSSPSGTLIGDVRLLVDFTQDRVTGVITNLITDASGTDQPLGVSFLVDTSSGTPMFTRHAVGGSLTVPLAVIEDSTGTRRACCGVLVGRFFGPNAKELSGGWLYESTDLTVRAVLGTTRDTGIDLNPGAIVSSDVAERAGTAAGTTFPLYSASGTLEGTRTLKVTGLDLRYLDAGFPQIVPFGAADVLSVSTGPTVATASGVAWREFSAADSSSGELAYTRYGRLSVPGATTPIEQSYHFGYETPLAAIPALGLASYYGQTAGTLTNGTTVESLSGLVNLQFDFDNSTLAGTLSAFVATNGAGVSRNLSGSILVSGQVDLSGSRAEHFSAVLNPPGGDGILSGHFFGPNAEEAGGSWSITTGSGRAAGAFGTRIADASHPAGAPRLAPWYGSVGSAFTLRETLVRATYASASAVPTMAEIAGGPSTLTVLGDGGVRLDTVRSATAYQGLLPGDAFGERTAAISGLAPAMQRFPVADENDHGVHLAGDGYLSYARFGYWEDRSDGNLSPVRGFFYAGRETPAGEVPTQGNAVYTGAFIGQGLSSEGLARLYGGLSLSADFAARTLSGSVSSIAVDWLARAGGGPAPSSFAFSEVRLQGTIAPGTNAFAGTADARTPGNAQVGTGSLDGRFFGREAQEIAGRFNIESPDTTVKAWGSFGGTR